MTKLSIIFMGTPAFATPALRALVKAGHTVIAAYSQPPRPAGRGQKLQKSPIQILAEEYGIQVHTPVSLKDPAEQNIFADYNADVAVVAAYGLLLPKAILEGTKLGCINIHPSLLPRWRGAAPLQRTIMAGDTKTAVCIMQMDAGLDTGPILAQENMALSDTITAGELHDVMAEKGAELLLRTLEKPLVGVPQSEVGVTYAKKITKEETQIDWNASAEEIYNKIRGLAPSPGAWCDYNGERLKIFAAEYSNEKHSAAPGSRISEKPLVFACGEGIIKPLRVQRPGKNIVSVDEFLR